MWLGKGKHFLVFPVRAGELVNYVGFVPADEAMRESWSAPGDPDQLRAEFAGWDPRIGGLLREVRHTFRWALYDREPLPPGREGGSRCSATPRIRCCRISARAPTSRSRTAWRSRRCSRARTARTRARRAARLREAAARARGGVQRGARQNGLRYDTVYADLAVRDAEIAAHAAFRKRLYDHDVVPEAKEVAEAL